jgi:hypothetical protein
MRLPNQAAPVKRVEIFEPAVNLKDMILIGAEPNDPSPFRPDNAREAICQILSPYAATECMAANRFF